MTCRCAAYNTVVAADSPRAYVVGDAMPPGGTSLYVSPGGTPDYTLALAGTAPSGNGALRMGPALSDTVAPVPFLLGDTLPSPITMGGPLSIECWIKPDGINLNYIPFGGSSGVVLLWNDATAFGVRQLFWTHTDPSNAVVYDQMLLEQPSGFLIGGGETGVAPTGAWHHVVFVADHAQSPNYVMDVDCRVRATNSGTSDDDSLTVDRLLIGCRTLNPAGDGLIRGWQPFSGLIADVALYDYALSRCQVMCHYEAATGLRCCGRRARAHIQITD